MFLILKYFEDASFFCLLELQDHFQFAVLLQADRQLLITAVKRMMGNLYSPWDNRPAFPCSQQRDSWANFSLPAMLTLAPSCKLHNILSCHDPQLTAFFYTLERKSTTKIYYDLKNVVLERQFFLLKNKKMGQSSTISELK